MIGSDLVPDLVARREDDLAVELDSRTLDRVHEGSETLGVLGRAGSRKGVQLGSRDGNRSQLRRELDRPSAGDDVASVELEVAILPEVGLVVVASAIVRTGAVVDTSGEELVFPSEAADEGVAGAEVGAVLRAEEDAALEVAREGVKRLANGGGHAAAGLGRLASRILADARAVHPRIVVEVARASREGLLEGSRHRAVDRRLGVVPESREEQRAIVLAEEIDGRPAVVADEALSRRTAILSLDAVEDVDRRTNLTRDNIAADIEVALSNAGLATERSIDPLGIENGRKDLREADSGRRLAVLDNEERRVAAIVLRTGRRNGVARANETLNDRAGGTIGILDQIALEGGRALILDVGGPSDIAELDRLLLEVHLLDRRLVVVDQRISESTTNRNSGSSSNHEFLHFVSPLWFWLTCVPRSVESTFVVPQSVNQGPDTTSEFSSLLKTRTL